LRLACGDRILRRRALRRRLLKLEMARNALHRFGEFAFFRVAVVKFRWRPARPLSRGLRDNDIAQPVADRHVATARSLQRRLTGLRPHIAYVPRNARIHARTHIRRTGGAKRPFVEPALVNGRYPKSRSCRRNGLFPFRVNNRLTWANSPSGLGLCLLPARRRADSWTGIAILAASSPQAHRRPALRPR
jgi:hypothetical protein